MNKNMKSLDERAKDYAKDMVDHMLCIPEEPLTEKQRANLEKGYYDNYIKIATEQKEYDIDRLFELIKPYLYDGVDRYSDANVILETIKKSMNNE